MNQQVATITEAPRRSVLIDMSTRYGMEPAAFEQTLRATVVPHDCTREQFAAFLLVAREYKLNPITKEIYAFATRGGGIQPIVSIDGWCNLINSHPKLNGIEFDDLLDKDGKLTAITARLWRKDREKPIMVTEYMEECKRATDPWKQYPRRMLRHKALIQAARYAFGFAGIVDPDEAERIGVMKDVTPNRDSGPPLPPVSYQTQPEPTNGGDHVDLDPARPLDARGRQIVEEATAEDVFDGAAWLRELGGALAGCEDIEQLAEVQKNVQAPAKGVALKTDWVKGSQMMVEAYARINALEEKQAV